MENTRKNNIFSNNIRGGIGTISGMYIFRHKTKKLQFTIGLPTITILEIIGIIYYLFINPKL